MIVNTDVFTFPVPIDLKICYDASKAAISSGTKITKAT
jgi:hypothetical protein